MEEELEQAIHLAFFSPPPQQQPHHSGGPSPHAEGQRQTAIAYLETLLQQPPERWLLLLQRLPMLHAVESRFWLLQQTLRVFLPRSTVEHRQALRSLLLRHYFFPRPPVAAADVGTHLTDAAIPHKGTAAAADGGSNRRAPGTVAPAVAAAPAHSSSSKLMTMPPEEDVAVKNKAILILVRLIQIDYHPNGAWPSAFDDVLDAFSAAAGDAALASLSPANRLTEVAAAGASPSATAADARQALARIEMCLRLLLVLHQEAVEDPALPRNTAETKRSAEIRAALRHYFAAGEEEEAEAAEEKERSAGGAAAAAACAYWQPGGGEGAGHAAIMGMASSDSSSSRVMGGGLWGGGGAGGLGGGASAAKQSYSAVLLQVLQLPPVKATPAMLCLACDVIRRYVGYMSLLLPPPSRGAAAVCAKKDSSSGGSTPFAAHEVDAAAAGEDADPTAAEMSGTLVHVLLEVWVTHACTEAAEAVAAFAHHKMAAETKARVLCRMGLAEALVTCAPQVAQRPALVPAFASMASTTASALFDAVYALRGGDSRLNRSSSSGSRGEQQQWGASTLRSNGASDTPLLGCAGTGAPAAAAAATQLVATQKIAAAAWQRVLLLLPILADLFACQSIEVSSLVEPFFSFFFNRMKAIQQQSAVAAGAAAGEEAARGAAAALQCHGGGPRGNPSLVAYSSSSVAGSGSSSCCTSCGRVAGDCCCARRHNQPSGSAKAAAATAADHVEALYLTPADMRALVTRMLQLVHEKISVLEEYDGGLGSEEQQLWGEDRGEHVLAEEQQEEEEAADLEESEELQRLRDYRELLNQLFKRVFAASVEVSFAWLRSRLASACGQVGFEATSAAASSSVAAAGVPTAALSPTALAAAVGGGRLPFAAAAGGGGEAMAAATAAGSRVWYELGAAVSLLLLTAEQYKDLSKLLKDPQHPFSVCVTTLISAPVLQQQQQTATQPPHNVRITLLSALVRFASFFQQQTQFIGAALQLILGPAGLGGATVAAAAQEELIATAALAAGSPVSSCSRTSTSDGSSPSKCGGELLRTTAPTAAARHARQRARRRVARNACIALLRFVKNTQPQVNTYAVPILEVLHQQHFLEVPAGPGDLSPHRSSSSTTIHKNGSSSISSNRGEMTRCAAGQRVEGTLFTFAEQQLIFEAVGLLLGAHTPPGSSNTSSEAIAAATAAGTPGNLLLQQQQQQKPVASNALPAGALSEATKVQLLQQLLQQLLHAFDVEPARQLAAALQEARVPAGKEEEVVRRILWWARICNAIASLSKGFRPAAAAGGGAAQRQQQQQAALSGSRGGAAGTAAGAAAAHPTRLCQQHIHHIWKNTLQHVSYATLVALSGCSVDAEGSDSAVAGHRRLPPPCGGSLNKSSSSDVAALTCPFLLSLIFLTRRMLFLLHADVLPFLPDILLRLYDPLPAPAAATSDGGGAAGATADAAAAPLAAAAPPGQQDRCLRASKAAAAAAPEFNLQAYSDQLVSFVTHVVFMLRSRVLPADGGFLAPQLFSRMLLRHFTLWWDAVVETPDLLRDQVERQEQLLLLVECIAKTAPAAVVPHFISAAPVSAAAAEAAASALRAAAAAAAAPPSRSSSGGSHAYPALFQQHAQQQPHAACVLSEGDAAAAAEEASASGGALAGLRYRDTRNVFVAALQQHPQLQQQPHHHHHHLHHNRHNSLLQQGEPAFSEAPEKSTAVQLTCFLLLCCSPACVHDGLCAMYAVQSWTHLLQHVLEMSQLPHLQQVQAAYRTSFQRQLQPPASPQDPLRGGGGGGADQQQCCLHHEAQQQQQVFVDEPVQQRAVQELLVTLPLRELLCATSQLLLSLDPANDAQHLRVLSDILGLWRLLLLGAGGGSVDSSRKHLLAAGAATARLPTFFTQLRQLLRLSLQDALLLLWMKTGEQQQQHRGQPFLRQKEGIAAEAARRLVESLVEIVDGKTSREELRRWVLLQQQQ